MTAVEPLLSLRDWSLSRRTGLRSRSLLENLDLDLVPGRWLAVLGANGSGKSSLLKFLACEEAPAEYRSAIVFQDPDEQLVADTAVRELALGRPGLDARGRLAEFGLAEVADLDPRILSAGQKQRLALATALAGDPQVLLCDEPTALQDRVQAEWVLERLDAWRSGSGRCLVTATCDRREVARADDLLVLAAGRPALAGPVAELAGHPLVEDLLGPTGASRSAGPGPAHASGSEAAAGTVPCLEVAGVACRFIGPGGGFGPATLTVRPGDRIGLTGPNGCGKSTLLGACAGVRRPEAGEIRLSGRPLYRRGALDLDHGAALLAPQFPEYFFTRSTVAQEIALDPALVGHPVAAFLGDLGLPADLVERNPHDLSTGQRRRLALGLVLRAGRPLVLLDEPTAALDRAGRRQVLSLLAELPPRTAVLIASHDAEFLAAAGCRILEMGPSGLRETAATA